MKKTILFLVCILVLGCNIVTPQAKGKTVFCSIDWNEEQTEAFLAKHKQDDVFIVWQGKVGTKFTSVFHYTKGTVYWDDWDNRADFKGHISKSKALKKYKKLYK